MHGLITTNGYTEPEDFAGSLSVVPELGDPPGETVTLESLKRLVADAG